MKTIRFFVFLICALFAIWSSTRSFSIRTRISPLKLCAVVGSHSTQREMLQPYSTCPQCKSTYLITPTVLSAAFSRSRNLKPILKCDVCLNEWQQDFSKLPTTNSSLFLTDLEDSHRNYIYDQLQRLRFLRSLPIPTKFSLYVTNIPLHYLSYDLAQLFAEYGVINAFIILNQQRESRGFGFVEVTIYNPFREICFKITNNKNSWQHRKI